MSSSYPSAVLAIAILAFVLMLVLLAAKRLRRDRAERIQAERLEQLRALIVDRDLDEGAFGALRRLARARPVELTRMERVLRQLDPVRLGILRELLPEELRHAIAARLVSELRRRDAPRRATGALLLGRLALPEAATILTPVLDDRDPDVAQSAARALGLLTDGTGARALIAALGADRIPSERLIESLLTPVAGPSLLAALADPSARDVHPHIVRALGLIGDDAAEEALLAATEGADVELHIAICRALGAAGTDRCVAYLIHMLAHDAWPVRAQAATALASRTATPAVVSALEDVMSDPAWWVRANAAGSLARLGGVGVAGLIRATRHADRYARARAEEALALIALDGATV